MCEHKIRIVALVKHSYITPYICQKTARTKLTLYLSNSGIQVSPSKQSEVRKVPLGSVCRWYRVDNSLYPVNNATSCSLRDPLTMIKVPTGGADNHACHSLIMEKLLHD